MRTLCSHRQPLGTANLRCQVWPSVGAGPNPVLHGGVVPVSGIIVAVTHGAR